MEDKTARTLAMNIVMKWCDTDNQESMVDLLMRAIEEAWDEGFKEGTNFVLTGAGDE